MRDIKRNIIIDGSENRPISLDIFRSKRELLASPLIIYVHGFKGFKDWGHSNLMAEQLSHAGFHFVKFNFSHNGISPEDPLELSDMEGFSNNNYERELYDLDRVSEYVLKESFIAQTIDMDRVVIVGHSRGGGIALIHGAENESITHIVTLAAVAKLDYAWDLHPNFEEWRNSGVTYVVNSRTGQNLPIGFQLYENFEAHKERLNIAGVSQTHSKPCLLFHGASDAVIEKEAADKIFQNLKNARKVIIPGMNHVFNSSHPWEEEDLPEFYRMFVKWMEKFVE